MLSIKTPRRPRPTLGRSPPFRRIYNRSSGYLSFSTRDILASTPRSKRHKKSAETDAQATATGELNTEQYSTHLILNAVDTADMSTQTDTAALRAILVTTLPGHHF